MKKTAIAFAALTLTSLTYAGLYKPEGFTPISIEKADNPIYYTNIVSRGENKNLKLHQVELNPFFVRHISDANPLSKDRTIDFDGLLVPEIYDIAVSELISDYKIVGVEHKSEYRAVVNAFLNEAQANSLSSDERVTYIKELHKKEFTPKQIYSKVSGDVVVGSQVKPWLVDFVNAQSGTATNPMYLVEGYETYYTNPQMHPNINLDLNLIIHGHPCAGCTGEGIQYNYHFGHIAGIVGAKDNNLNIRGVNPGQPIKYYRSVMGDGPNIREALERAARDAEAENIFSTLNLSSNYDGDAEVNSFGANDDVGLGIRYASNRLFVTESAGNYEANACQYSYNNPQAYDGVMVVGAVKQNGSRMLTADGGTNPTPVDPQYNPALSGVKGSNYGSCVEAWAPGYQITSLDYYTGGTRVSSGTSYASPIVGAIASRAGGSQIRPITREDYIYQNVVSGLAGPLAKIGTNSILMHHLPLSKVENIASPGDIPYLRNGKYFDGQAYNFMAKVGSMRVNMASGSPIVRGVRISLGTSAGPKEVAPITIVAYDANNNLIGNQTIVNQYDNTPIFMAFTNHVRTNSIRFEVNNQVSWFALYEVEIYGSP
ncbi:MULTISPECIES: S8 family serine peptidase [unclassified Comamonas]|uniref:S8 family serine peptidase n=1 Tax=unclassified Comamonas TaxID=2638500 RepID=UPI001EFAB072|nr:MULTISPECIES: S8 family serine peptidase [unclassified Comamonas]ULR91222.1 S8 family serine peptidase [Comamonas sp. B21-038]